ncbi:MAG TPA: FHA domain-containing protein [Verrucomicrobiae bacterium]
MNTPRLVVNPGSPAAWEIQLKPGDNFIGRGFSNDVKLTDPSVSGSHCQITVSEGSVVLKDLGSTNGTFVNRLPVREAVLQTGQTVHLGGVEMMFYADSPATASSAKTVAAVRMVGAPVRATAAPVAAKARVTTTSLPRPAPVPFSPTASPVPLPPPPMAAPQAPPAAADIPPVAPPMPVPTVGTGQCKYHPNVAGRFFCPRCQHYFCELCVNTRQETLGAPKFCRVCGSQCSTVAAPSPRALSAPSGFFAQMFTAFAYPLKGDGLFLLLAGTVFFCVLDAGKFFAAFAGLFGLIAIVILFVIGTGYLTCFLRRIVTSTAMGESKLPDWPDVTDVASDVIAPFLQLAATVVACFLPAIVVGIFAASGHPSAVWGLIPAVVFGCIYFPMAFLAVAMLDTIVAVNPMVVLPTILRVPLAYIMTLVLFGAIVVVRVGGELLLATVLPVRFVAAIVLNLAGLYLLTVEMRVLGILYLTNKTKFGWLNR